MTDHADALRAATETFRHRLRAEADEQCAYLFDFPNGRVSIELEWVDLESITTDVIATYLAHLNTSSTPTMRKLVGGARASSPADIQNKRGRKTGL